MKTPDLLWYFNYYEGLTDKEAKKALWETTLMPPWHVHGEVDGEGIKMVVTATTPSSTQPETTIDIRIETYLPPGALRNLVELDEFVHWRFRRILFHEVDEWHKRNGVQIRKPKHGGMK